MTRIDRMFADLRSAGRTALMPFITAGFPSLEATAESLAAMESAGASAVELGFPFSDPIADGPVVAASMHEALERGVTPQAVLDLVRRVRPRTQLALIAMVSISIVHRMGAARFVGAAADAGIDGLIVPDLDTAAAGGLVELAAARALGFSLLVAPTTGEARAAALARQSRGFVYVLARVGLTGERDGAPAVAERVAALRAHTDLPIAVGFGISTAEHVRAVTRSADAAIVGSALVRRMGAAADPAAAAGAFVAELAAGLARRPPEPRPGR